MDQPYIEPLYLMQFSVDADVVDIIWVLERMVKRKAEGGAELLIQCRNPTQDKVCHVIHIFSLENRKPKGFCNFFFYF